MRCCRAVCGRSGNYLLFRYRPLRPLFSLIWDRMKRGRPVEGVSAEAARATKAAVSILVTSTGGYQTASFIRGLLEDRYFDAVSIARALLANPDLLRDWDARRDLPERPCTYCNKCLLNVLKHPLGCYELIRFSELPGDGGRYPFGLPDAYVCGFRAYPDLRGTSHASGAPQKECSRSGLFRQSVFGRLAGYEDVNDAERLRHDPAMRWIVGGKAAQRSAASPSQMGRFETQWLAAPKNFAALADLLAGGSTLCTAEGHPVASCSTWIQA